MLLLPFFRFFLLGGLPVKMFFFFIVFETLVTRGFDGFERFDVMAWGSFVSHLTKVQLALGNFHQSRVQCAPHMQISPPTPKHVRYQSQVSGRACSAGFDEVSRKPHIAIKNFSALAGEVSTPAHPEERKKIPPMENRYSPLTSSVRRAKKKVIKKEKLVIAEDAGQRKQSSVANLLCESDTPRRLVSISSGDKEAIKTEMSSDSFSPSAPIIVVKARSIRLDNPFALSDILKTLQE